MPEVTIKAEKKLSYERGKTTRELEQRLARLDKLKTAAKTLQKSQEENETETKPEVESKKRAMKYNFVHLRKK